jgi:predicted ATP-dependent serine protease
MNCSFCSAKLPERRAQCPVCFKINRLDGGGTSGKTIRLSEAVDASISRIQCGFWDKVLGGGIVTTSVILIGAEPGTGKTTLALQMADEIVEFYKHEREVLYIGAEQATGEIKATGTRLLLKNMYWIQVLPCLGDFSGLEQFDSILQEMNPAAVFLDSLPGLVGSDQAVSVELAAALKRYASKGRPILIIDHVTKGDDFAGKKALQHEVDVLLTMRVHTDSLCACGHDSAMHKNDIMECKACEPEECLGYSGTRTLACETKNRYGKTPCAIELDMTETGLHEQ